VTLPSAAPVPVSVPTPVAVPVPAYPYGYNTGVLGGDLSGYADLPTANALCKLTIQQAKLAQEDVTRSRIETRRKLNEEYEYQYRNRPTSAKMVAEEREARLRRSRNNPPSTVIWSGDVLNDLLAAIQDNETDLGVRGPSIPLDVAAGDCGAAGTAFASGGGHRSVARGPARRADLA
jgi:hypothetical protein